MNRNVGVCTPSRLLADDVDLVRLLDSEHAVKSGTAHFLPFTHHVSLVALAVPYSSGTPDRLPGHARRQIASGRRLESDISSECQPLNEPVLFLLALSFSRSTAEAAAWNPKVDKKNALGQPGSRFRRRAACANPQPMYCKPI